VSGRVIRLTEGGAVLDSAGQEIEVSFSRIIDVWRETFVASTAIEVGDDLIVNGTDGSPFMAAHISANIGRVDGVIREIDEIGMLVEVQLRWGGTKLQHLDFSPYIEYGYAGGPKLTRADLVVGSDHWRRHLWTAWRIAAGDSRLVGAHCHSRAAIFAKSWSASSFCAVTEITPSTV
jgi:hypothetical protein